MRVSQPRPGEPIRVVQIASGVRYRITIDVGRGATGRRRQVTATRATLTAAREFIEQTRGDVARGTHSTPDRMTFSQLADQWLESRRDLRQVTRANYASALRAVRARWGDRRVQAITRADAEALVASLANDGGKGGQGRSQRSVVYLLGIVKQVLDYAVNSGIVPTNVAAKVKAPRRRRGDTREVTVWEPGELLQFRDRADDDDWAAAWRITLCGLRRSEVMGLRWSSVDLDAGAIVIDQGRVLVDGHRTAVEDPKSAASWRTVPIESMHPGTIAALRSFKAQQAAHRLSTGPAYEDSGYVLVDALGRPVRHEAYSDRFKTLCSEAGVPLVHLHSVRHTLASQMHRAGVAPADAAALLGHSIAVHLSSYVTKTERGTQSAASALGEVLAAAR